ncbi:hypothetical protein SERLADRAFT_455117 [Serpula lacrymans var. lacrymans S7.9]|nr:uncharacterized protein SERLADRAFT_455117 [Serpula lacrymans var. lacrymans S7.9]EGO30833.1 hypothetical protein SERLADRAFT_455117 [Serpula lacrymans var. lacrymans S7.9]
MIYIMSLGETKHIVTLKGHTNEVNSVKCSPSKTHLASCADDGTARIWDVTDIHNPKYADDCVILAGHTSCLTGIDWSPNSSLEHNELVATASFDLTARLWDSKTGECLRVFMDHFKHVYALSFSPDGRHLATGGGDGWLHIYDTEVKEKLWSWYTGEKSGIFEIDWHSWGKESLVSVALESRAVAVINFRKITAPQLDT